MKYKFLSDEEIEYLEEQDKKICTLIPKGLSYKQLRSHPAYILHMSIQGRIFSDWSQREMENHFYSTEMLETITKKARNDIKNKKIYHT